VRCLVTGGTGFIGRRLVARLVERHGARSIACLVRPHAKPAEAAALARFEQLGVTLLRGDLLDAPVSPTPAPRVDVVFHLAANIDTEAPESAHRVNDRGTANLVEWLAPVLAGCRIIYTSSVAVIDRAGPADGPMREDTAFRPRTAYGVTKLRGEHILREHAGFYGYTWTIVRLPTVYGPGEKAGGMFDLLIQAAKEGSLVSRLNWPGRTSILYLDDAAAILDALAFRPDAADELFMVSSGENCTVADISRAAGDLVGRPVRPIRLPPVAWRVLRAIVWNPLVRRAVPRAAFVAYWRLSLIIDDGFWCDPAKLLAVYRDPVVLLLEGLRRTIEG
jgi:nucleoside-diphosphate-sugar epimerase